jgi:hypothetical protein
MPDPQVPDPQRIAQVVFADALLRVDRVEEHLAELEPKVEAFTERQKGKIQPVIEGRRAVLRVLAGTQRTMSGGTWRSCARRAPADPGQEPV